ncbi:hypothetical protein ACFLRQ_03665, partial [Bacteroidota bacterium]
FAGLSLVIVLESVNQRVFKKQMSGVNKQEHKPILVSLARICTISMFVYVFMVMLVFLHGKDYQYFNGPWGYWYLLEIVGFVVIPGILFLFGYRQAKVNLVRIAAVMSIIGIILNRMNISTIAFNDGTVIKSTLLPYLPRGWRSL